MAGDAPSDFSMSSVNASTAARGGEICRMVSWRRETGSRRTSSLDCMRWKAAWMSNMVVWFAGIWGPCAVGTNTRVFSPDDRSDAASPSSCISFVRPFVSSPHRPSAPCLPSPPRSSFPATSPIWMPGHTAHAYL